MSTLGTRRWLRKAGTRTGTAQARVPTHPGAVMARSRLVGRPVASLPLNPAISLIPLISTLTVLLRAALMRLFLPLRVPMRMPRSALKSVLMFGLMLGLTVAPLAVLAQGDAQPARPAEAPVVVLTLDGIVGPATADYLVRGLREADTLAASAVVLQIDTPGGLDTSMRAIIQAIVRSPVPVIGFVAPSGARAASAGAFILYATHLAAMAPATNVGAATPVAIGAAPSPAPGSAPKPEAASDKGRAAQRPAGEAEPDKAKGREPASASEAKAVNDAVAYLRSLAELRGRNADFAEQAVRDAASLSSRAALDRGVIELIANDLDDLLVKADGLQIRIGDHERTLAVRDAARVEIAPDWRTRLLGFIANPNIALLLLMIGVYGLLFEFMTPGAVAPGVIGGISLLLGLYALSFLSLNHTGIALMLLGLALLVAEAFVPAFGVLGLGGITALVIGAAMLVDVDGVPAFEIGWPMLAGLALAGIGLVVLIGRTAAGSLKRAPVSGSEAMIGQLAEVEDWHGDAGHVFVHGERWNAVMTAAEAATSTGPAAGALVRIVSLDGLTLTVTARTGAAAHSPRARPAGFPST